MYSGLNLPARNGKPRENGITVLIDNGVPLRFFEDTMDSSGDYIDYVKFGWGTSLVTRGLERKINCLRSRGIGFFFGGTLFEKFAAQGKMDDYERFLQTYHCECLEISNGTLDIPNDEKAGYIRRFAGRYKVFSEVGAKDGVRSMDQTAAEWAAWIREDLEAGAYKVITEARESGTSGLCRADGQMRLDIVDEIAGSGIPLDRILFEAPSKALQTLFIQLNGANVNLANIPFSDAISLETLRLGLRSDTFFLFDK